MCVHLSLLGRAAKQACGPNMSFRRDRCRIPLNPPPPPKTRREKVTGPKCAFSVLVHFLWFAVRPRVPAPGRAPPPPSPKPSPSFQPNNGAQSPAPVAMHEAMVHKSHEGPGRAPVFFGSSVGALKAGVSPGLAVSFGESTVVVA